MEILQNSKKSQKKIEKITEFGYAFLRRIITCIIFYFVSNSGKK